MEASNWPERDQSTTHADTVNIVTWFLLVSSVVAALARLLTKRALHRNLALDDGTLLVALLLSIAQAVTVSLQVANGLGQHMESLESAKVTRFLKFAYASDLCYTTTLWVSKISALLLIRALTPVRVHRTTALIAGGLIAAYGVTGTFVVAFQCALPQVWDFVDDSCLDKLAWEDYFCTANIVTELVLLLLPLQIIWSLQLNFKRKAKIFVCFAGRSLVVIAVICQLYFVNQDSSPRDPTFTMWKAVLSANVVQNTSIITACIPCLKPLLESLETGMMRSDDLLRRQGHHRYLYGNSNSYKLSEALPKSNPTALSLIRKHPLDNNLATRTTAQAVKLPPHALNWEAERQESSSQGIKTTRSWTVDITGKPSYGVEGL